MLDATSTTSLKHDAQNEQMHRDALEAFEEYKRTGLHVTEEEAEAWLTQLENGQDAAVPKCHV